jgi:signal transduction histidine kinase
VEEVTNGVELLDSAREVIPDLMILDIMMPELDGLSALEIIREDELLASCYVILLTGKSTLQEKLKGFNCGADDYITKPYALVELKARVRAGIRIKAMQKNLVESHQILVRQEKMATIGVLAAGIAHEFNNIMSGISGYAQLAKNTPRFADRLIEVALEQSARAQQITSSLSSFAQGATAGTKHAVLSTVIDAALCLLKKDLKRREIEVEVHTPENVRTVAVNTSQLQQVFVHLLINASHAIGNDGKIVMTVSMSGDRVLAKVEDSGPGVPETLRSRIFDPFFTTKGALGHSVDNGTGLGLAFCQNIIQGHEGTLTVGDSELGGACFTIEIPDATAVRKSQETVSDVPRPAEQRRLNMVYVEDDVTLQEVVSELFGDNPPAMFSDGPSALDHCRDRPVDVVILDLTLDGPWDGWTLLKKLGDLDSPPGVILTTGSIALSDPSFLEYPGLQILPKPFQLVDLENAVTSFGAKPLAEVTARD